MTNINYFMCIISRTFSLLLYLSSLITEIGVLDIVRPFCLVVINEETTGPITGLAIGALDKFLASGLLGI